MPRYRVTLNSWDTFKLFVDAPTKDEAIAEAERRWDEEGPEAFGLVDSGVDQIDAEEIK